jgi:hypothetical protein
LITVYYRRKLNITIILTKEEANYLAGFADGDGSFVGQIVKQPQYILKFLVRVTFSLHQATKRKWFLDSWKERIGGTTRTRLNGTMSDLDLVGPKNVLEIVPQILPYLQIKKRQAELLLQIAEQIPLIDQNPMRLLELCVLTDRISELNDSTNRTITSEVVREEFIKLGFIKE